MKEALSGNFCRCVSHYQVLRAVMSVAQKGEVKMADEYRYIGKPMKRRDAEGIVTGTAQYLDDLKFQDLLCGKVKRSPHAHAVIRRIDKRGPSRCPA